MVTLLLSHLGSQISRDNGFRKTQRFLPFGQPLFHLFVASLELGIAGTENTKTRSQGPGFEYRLPFGGLSKKRSWVVGRGRFELPQLARRFYRPLGSPMPSRPMQVHAGRVTEMVAVSRSASGP